MTRRELLASTIAPIALPAKAVTPRRDPYKDHVLFIHSGEGGLIAVDVLDGSWDKVLFSALYANNQGASRLAAWHVHKHLTRFGVRHIHYRPNMSDGGFGEQVVPVMQSMSQWGWPQPYQLHVHDFVSYGK